MTTETQQQLDVPQLVLEASERCQDYLSPTPLEYSLYLSKEIEGEVWLKLDSMQIGGAGGWGLLKHKARFRGKKVVAVACGRNINLDVFKRIIA